MNNKYCYATLADSPYYLKEALALAISLQQVESKYPLFIMVPAGAISDEIIENFKLYLPKNTYIKFIYSLIFDINSTSQFNTTINKFQILSFLEYDLVCFLDADIYVLNNIDYCFNHTQGNTLETHCFILKPDINLFSLILWHINLNFLSDGDFFDYLYSNNLIPKSIYKKRISGDDILHDRQINKFFYSLSFKEIIEICNQDIILLLRKHISSKTDNNSIQINTQYNTHALLNNLNKSINNNYIDFL